VGADSVEAAALAGAIEKNGSLYLFEGTSIGQGRHKARDAILTDAAPRWARASRTGSESPPHHHGS